MTIEKLIRILRRYSKIAIEKSEEFLFKPEDAIKLVDELHSIEIPVMGITGWYYVGDPKDGNLAEDMRVDYYVGDKVWFGDNRVDDSTNLVKVYILNHLTLHTDFVSLDLDISNWQEIFARIKDNNELENS